MPRDFFKRSTDGSQGVGGSIITDIQASLNAITSFDIKVDGSFGRQTEQAVTGFQTARGLPVTGTVSDTTWAALMHSSEPPIFERCLQVVASFEGTQFTLIEGNFDGAGLTWGIIGFTLKNGEISSLLGEIQVKFTDLLSQAFGHDTAELLEKVGPNASAKTRMDFANSISGPGPQFRVAEPWRTGFDSLGRQREVQRLQVERARAEYWTGIALRDASALGLTEELDLLLMFDIAVQDGGMGSNERLASARERLNSRMSGLNRRSTIAEVVVDTISGPFKEDVRQRKMCIANGHGTVHRGNYELAGWALADGFVPTLIG
ncbi:MAG TPA: peptidoglycan-binding protein [Stellaceae bacterium]|nr:peptidoglycan-binding protein [Stellaceae bacterium]